MIDRLINVGEGAKRARCASPRSYSEQFTGYSLSGFDYFKAHAFLIETLDSSF